MKNKIKANTVKQILAKVMLVAMIFSLISMTGCEFVLSNTIENQPNTNTPEHHEPEDLVNGMLAKMQAAGYEEMKATAYMYYQAPDINRRYLLDLEIVDGKLIINGKTYDKITYDTEYIIEYDSLMFIDDIPENEEKFEKLREIQKHKGFYILKCSTSDVAFDILACEYDNTYYFLILGQLGTVIRVHSLVIE